MCGTAATCAGNTAADSCDAGNNQCLCGGAAMCALAGETCVAGACMCGTAATCVGNAAADGCDAVNNICICGGMAECTGGMTCMGSACV